MKSTVFADIHNMHINFCSNGFSLLAHLMNHASNTPGASAVQYNSNILTYSTLHERSSSLAGYLQSLSIGQNHIIGILLPHSLELPISLLGVLKSGAAYLPLDPDYPDERLHFMIEDAKPTAIITHRHLLAKIKNLPPSVRIIILDEINSNTEFAYPTIEKNDIAYIIYTSGSTGKPKGVMVTHHNLNHFLNAVQQHIKLHHTDRFFSVTPISFDIFMLELYLPLLQGACCIMNDPAVRRDPVLLQAQLDSSQATFIQATPATYIMLTQSPWQNHHLRGLLCGGETWDITLAKNIFGCVSEHAQLWNMYGPTEATIWCACEEIFRDSTIIRIGQPLDELKSKLDLYYDGMSSHPSALPYVTVMLHTFIADSVAQVKPIVEKPLKHYLRTALELEKTRNANDLTLTDDDIATILDFSFERYFHRSGLFGSPASCVSQVNNLKELRVNEIACLIDFGIDESVVLQNIRHIAQLSKLVNEPAQLNCSILS